MRTFCVYTEQVEVSRKLADRCVASARPFGVPVERFPSVYWEDIQPVAKRLGLTLRLAPHHQRKRLTTQTHCPAFRIANGLTHYQLYVECVAGKRPVFIMEHDVVMVGQLPETVPDGVTQVSSHTDGQMCEDWYRGGLVSGRHEAAGPMPEFDGAGIVPHPYRKTVGTSGYIITPDAAWKMVKHIQRNGVAYADCVHADVVGPLWLAIPQPVEMRKPNPIHYYAT